MKHCLYLLLWKDKERSRIRVVQRDNLRRLLGIRRMDRALNAQIKELCGLKKWPDERIDEGVLQWRGWSVIGLQRVYEGVCGVV